jgi:hypothetical protein
MYVVFLTTLMFDFLINGKSESPSFLIKEGFVNKQEEVVLVTNDNRIVEYKKDKSFVRDFSINVPGSPKSRRAVAALKIPNSDMIWVSDIANKELLLFKEGNFIQAIKSTPATQLFFKNERVLACPPMLDQPFKWLNLQGEVVSSFVVPFPWDSEAKYPNKLWRSVASYLLPGNKIAIICVWANKMLIVNEDGSELISRDLESIMAEHRVGNIPSYMSHAGAAPAGTNLWILTCDHATKSCARFVLYDWQNNRLLGTAKLNDGIASFKQTASQHYLVIDRQRQSARFTKEFPYPFVPVKESANHN